MKQPPIPRPQAYDLYWYFAAERQAMFERKQATVPPPCTRDPILQTYKFCNVYRACDRVSQYLIREVAYADEIVSAPDRLFQIIGFRLFSNIQTWDSVRRFLGRAPLLSDVSDGSLRQALEAALTENGKLYTGAFILCAANSYGQGRKYLNHIELLRHMFLYDNLAERILEAPSLAAIYHALRAYPLMGNFMSYQIAIDLNYSALINFSENDFTMPGPGALRGMKKIFQSFGDYTPAELVFWMVENQEREFRRLGLTFNGLLGRPLQAIDCQGLFCETDKYCRVALPELASTRSRIKARYQPTPEPLSLFLPPKWNLTLPA